MLKRRLALAPRVGVGIGSVVLEEEEEEDVFVFNDTTEGLRAPAVKPGRVEEIVFS
jgi:hypothetical protein